jgi:transposase
VPIVDSFRRRYNLKQLVIIADNGLLSKSNIDELQAKGYEFVLGARIKNETTEIKNKILALSLENGQSEIIKEGDLRLIITYSGDRAKKDRYSRDKGIRKLEKQIRRGRLTKASINNRGYNKFLKLEGQINVSLDAEKLKQESRWDGLKGYLTNAKLHKNQSSKIISICGRSKKPFGLQSRILKSGLSTIAFRAG